MFDLTQEAEVQYESAEWDESLIQSAGKIPAGPLFDIQCSGDAVSQIGLPHSETKEGKVSSVFTDVSFLQDVQK